MAGTVLRGIFFSVAFTRDDVQGGDSLYNYNYNYLVVHNRIALNMYKNPSPHTNHHPIEHTHTDIVTQDKLELHLY